MLLIVLEESFRSQDSEIPEFRVISSFRFRTPGSEFPKFYFGSRFRIPENVKSHSGFGLRIPDSVNRKMSFRTTLAASPSIILQLDIQQSD